MSDVSKINELIAELKDLNAITEYTDDWLSDLVGRAADALEAATRVPVQGEPNDDREAENIAARLFPLDGSDPDTVFEARRRAVEAIRIASAAVPDAATGRFECDRNCVGEGSPVEDCSAHGRTPRDLWEQIEKVAAARDRWESLCGRGVEKRLALEVERDAALAAIERVRAIHAPDSVVNDACSECSDFGTDEHPVWLSAPWPCPTIAALDGAPEPEGRWEYRGRLQSCGFVAEGYISAEHAMNGLKEELEEHPCLELDETVIVERARVREWLPVEGESNAN